MMVIVPRIAAVSCFSTMPFIYGIQHADNLCADFLSSDPAEIIRLFSDREADFALLPAAAVPSLGDAHIITGYCVGGVPAAREALLGSDDPLVVAWREWGCLPFAFAVWVARKDADPEAVAALEDALTHGLEHSYEALLESGFDDDAVEAYMALQQFDYIFDNQKRKALQKFWDSGLKVAPRANPG